MGSATHMSGCFVTVFPVLSIKFINLMLLRVYDLRRMHFEIYNYLLLAVLSNFTKVRIAGVLFVCLYIWVYFMTNIPWGSQRSVLSFRFFFKNSVLVKFSFCTLLLAFFGSSSCLSCETCVCWSRIYWWAHQKFSYFPTFFMSINVSLGTTFK